MSVFGRVQMTNEIGLAFSHPIKRSVASGISVDDQDVDRISLRDHIVEVEIGAFQAERGTTQRICFNVVVEVRQILQAQVDDVDRILSYDKVTEAISQELAEERLNLLETLAERVADRILLEQQAVRAFVRIEKLDRGPGALGVEIVRSRRAVPQLVAEDVEIEEPHPTVVYLSNAALDSQYLTRWVDALKVQSGPVILCVGLPKTPTLSTESGLVQRRIDLLAIEQNCWRLAGLDARCVVVATRTELDWGMKNDQISVWAPSKIVLDTVDTPAPAPGESADLALWLGQMLQAVKVLLVGGPEPASDLAAASQSVPVEVVAVESVEI